MSPMEVVSMVNSKSYVRITDDKTEAWLYLCAPEEGAGYEKTEIIQYLQKNKVVMNPMWLLCVKRRYMNVKLRSLSAKQEKKDVPGIMNSFLKPVKENPRSEKMAQ